MKDRSEMRRALACRLVDKLNELGPSIGYETAHSINPLAELMTFYWVEETMAVRSYTNNAKRKPGWMGFVHYNRQEFVELADFLIPEAKQL